MSIKNKVVIITGASSGIGKATALLLAESGAKVVLAERNQEKLEKAVNEIKERNGEAVYKVTDVSKREEVKSLVDFTISKYGKIDVIFNNAGLMPNSPLSEFRTDEWDEMIDVNLKGVVNGIEAVLPHFIEQKSGHVISTSSVAGLNTSLGAGIYCATKHGVKALMEVLRKESANEKRNIRTTTLYLGAFKTELAERITNKAIKERIEFLYDTIGADPIIVAEAVKFAIDLPEEVSINEMTLYPTAQL